jgi:hypothetical protein
MCEKFNQAGGANKLIDESSYIKRLVFGVRHVYWRKQSAIMCNLRKIEFALLMLLIFFRIMSELLLVAVIE